MKKFEIVLENGNKFTVTGDSLVVRPDHGTYIFSREPGLDITLPKRGPENVVAVVPPSAFIKITEIEIN